MEAMETFHPLQKWNYVFELKGNLYVRQPFLANTQSKRKIIKKTINEKLAKRDLEIQQAAPE